MTTGFIKALPPAEDVGQTVQVALPPSKTIFEEARQNVQFALQTRGDSLCFRELSMTMRTIPQIERRRSHILPRLENKTLNERVAKFLTLTWFLLLLKYQPAG
jgi:hypothetical protein